MTNELEKQFFNTFNIEPIGCNDNKNCTGVLDCTQCPNAEYPQITSDILLELICILSEIYSYDEENWFIQCDIKDTLKEFILEQLIQDKGSCWHDATQQVQALFEEG